MRSPLEGSAEPPLGRGVAKAPPVLLDIGGGKGHIV